MSASAFLDAPIASVALGDPEKWRRRTYRSIRRKKNVWIATAHISPDTAFEAHQTLALEVCRPLVRLRRGAPICGAPALPARAAAVTWEQTCSPCSSEKARCAPGMSHEFCLRPPFIPLGSADSLFEPIEAWSLCCSSLQCCLTSLLTFLSGRWESFWLRPLSIGLGKKVLQHSLVLVMDVESYETLKLPDSLFLFLCLQPFSPLKEKTIDMLDVSGNAFVRLMTAYFSL